MVDNRLRLVLQSIELLSEDIKKNTDQINEGIKELLILDTEMAFKAWEYILEKEDKDYYITEDLIYQFAEKAPRYLFEMVETNSITFKNLAELESYDKKYLAFLGEYLSKVKDIERVEDFLFNALDTNGDNYSFAKTLLTSFMFVEEMDNTLLDKIKNIIDDFAEKMEEAELVQELFKELV